VTDFQVRRRGTDTSGRAIFTTDYMWGAYQGVLASAEVDSFADKVTIVQGAFMTKVPGGGAVASAGYHDAGGCIDFRTWNLTTAELNAFIGAWRRRGGAAWRRDGSLLHGDMEDHCHVTLGSDSPLSSGAQDSWQQYLDGTNGLTGSSHGRDYERRPAPLVLKYDPEEIDVQLSDKLGKGQDTATVRDALQAAIHTQKALFTFRKNLVARDAIIIDMLTELSNGLDDGPSKAQVRRIRTLLKKQVADDE
jgi:hypothetical protein